MQVPFTLQDVDIPDDWECAQNVWDEEHNSCTVPQALTDAEIDEILSFQVPSHSPLLPFLPPSSTNLSAASIDT